MKGSQTMLLPVRVILNVLAGVPAKANDVMCQRLRDLFQQQGIHPRISLVRTGSEVRELAQRAVQERYQTVVAGGGDGTINAVASALVGTEVALGVLPLGTLNHFAKDLRIPLDPSAHGHRRSRSYRMRPNPQVLHAFDSQHLQKGYERLATRHFACLSVGA